MRKIAKTLELRTELIRLAQQCVPGVSRQEMISGLRDLANRLSSTTVPESYTEAKKLSDKLYENVRQTEKALKEVSGEKGKFNLTPDHVRNTPEWKKAKRDYDTAFKALQDFNTVYTRRFKKEIQKDREGRR